MKFIEYINNVKVLKLIKSIILEISITIMNLYSNSIFVTF